ncbi:MAG TPA: response regulator [Opitutaceae bacterium]|nr:response regulator [Opitutaceae bacterium]
MFAENGYSLLIVDDDTDQRMIMEKAAMRTGLYSTIETAADGEEALYMINEYADEHGGLDLVLTDFKMPRMNGRELAQALQNGRSLTKVPIVCISASDDPADKQSALDAGCLAFYRKTGNVRDLIALFRSLPTLIGDKKDRLAAD